MTDWTSYNLHKALKWTINAKRIVISLLFLDWDRGARLH